MYTQLYFDFYDAVFFLDNRTLDDVAGESTVGGVARTFKEIIDNLPKDKIIVFETSLMNEQI